MKEVDWPESTKKNQIAWIGKSEGSMIPFVIKAENADFETSVDVYTTRADTLFGATYLVLAPEHPFIQEALTKGLIENDSEVKDYIEKTKRKSSLQRLENKEKSGVVLKGLYSLNPAREKAEMSDSKIPVFISDYVLSDYGTGAVMAVPAHDVRDWEFAKLFTLPMIEVVEGGDIQKQAYEEAGLLVNSGNFSGLPSEKAKKEITEFVGGFLKTNYRLKDWSVSRQRYWGTPIPIVYDPEGEAHFVGEENLPWLLPEDVDFIPTGTAPLAKSKELKQRVEKIFGKGWTPEYDTMDTFVDSSWYFLRYPDPKNEERFCSKERLEKWLPVDLYIGGAEHTYMHLLYARFFVKAMKKMGLLDFNEPFLKLRHQGMVLDSEGVKMSKSKGNVVNPDDVVARFGADATRLFSLFAAPLNEDIVWNENNIVGVYRFLEKVYRQKEKLVKEEKVEIKKKVHFYIKRVEKQSEDFKFNTAVSDMMKLVNFLDKEKEIPEEDFLDFLKILYPYAPHISDELYWQITGEKFLIKCSYPKYDEALAQPETVILPVQINGKTRGKIEVSEELSEPELLKLISENSNLNKYLKGEIKKVIYVKGKIINILLSE